jgi:hypothetical protein
MKRRAEAEKNNRKSRSRRMTKKMMQSRTDNSDRGSHPHMRRLIKEFE